MTMPPAVAESSLDFLGYIPRMDDTTPPAPQPEPGSARRVLVVDDQETIRLTVRTALERDGFVVETCADGTSALERLQADPPALVVLDVGLPDMDGLEILREIRRTTELPVVMLTARDEEFDRVLGLELGADDYVSKPFSSRELAARVKTVLRRSGARASEPAGGTADVDPGGARIQHGTLIVDTSHREVLLHGEPVEMTRREFDLLAMLVASPRQVFSREQLLRGVWDSSSDWQAPSTVTEHVRRLRQKLEADPADPKMLLTVRGVGYRFMPPA